MLCETDKEIQGGHKPSGGPQIVTWNTSQAINNCKIAKLDQRARGEYGDTDWDDSHLPKHVINWTVNTAFFPPYELEYLNVQVPTENSQTINPQNAYLLCLIT